MNPIRIEIPKELFTPAGYKHYEGAAALEFLKLGPDLFEFKEPLAWQADITNTGGALLVTGTVEGEATCGCARCLGPVTFPVTGEIEGYFLVSPEDSVPDDMEEDEFDYLPADKAIDMTPLIQAALILEMPQVPLCSDDCKGLCPKCGANLNEGDCGCSEGEQAAEDAANPFAVLKDFDFGS